MRAVLSALTVVSLVACNNFDERLDGGCAAGATWCQPVVGGGTTSTGGGTTTGGGSATGGGGGNEPIGGGGNEPIGGGGNEPIPDAGTDAGTPDAGPGPIDAGTRLFPEASCVGRFGWCWQTGLGAVGSTDLLAVWGTSDNDVFVAGTGSSLFHYDGTVWRQVATSVPAPDPSRSEPAYFAVAGAPSGTVVVSGEQLPLYGLKADGSWSTLTALARWRPGMAGTPSTLFVASNDAQTKYETVTANDAVSSLTTVSSRGSVQAVVASGNTAWFTINDSPRGVVSTSNTTGWNFEALFNPDVFRLGPMALRDGLPVVLFGQDRSAWLQPDGGWHQLPRPTIGTNYRAHVFTQSGNDWWWWLAGEQGHVLLIDPASSSQSVFPDGGVQAIQVLDSAFDGFSAMWVSPQGTVWVVGSGGRVVAITGGHAAPTPTDKTIPTTTLMPGLVGRTYDVDVRGEMVAVVGQQGFYRYRETTNGPWISGRETYETVASVSISPDGGVFMIDQQGGVYAAGSTTAQFTVTSATDVGRFDRIAALDHGSDGTLYASYGAQLKTRLPSGTVTSTSLGGTWNQTADVVAGEGGVWLAVNQSTNLSSTSGGGVFFVPDDGGTPSQCGTTLPNGVVSLGLTDSGVSVAGNTTLGRCDGMTYTNVTPPTSPMATPWTSYLRDSSNRWWALNQAGYLYMHNGTNWVPERNPASRSEKSGMESWRLREQAGTFFLGAGSGNVLIKTIP